jgi:hypothetical protein
VAEIGSSESTQFAHAQTGSKTVAGALREGFAMHLHEGRSLFAVEQGFNNMAGIEHRSDTPIHHDASNREACLDYVAVLAKALLETRVTPSSRKDLKAFSGTISAGKIWI